MALELDAYRERAELFCEQIDREHYEHYAGHKRSFEIEAIYDRHAELFERGAVERLRELHAAADGEGRRRLRELLRFAFSGQVGQAVKAEAAEMAELEATLEVDAGGSQPLAYRGVALALATEPDGERRAEIESARDGVLEQRLNPLQRTTLERTHALCRELGWRSYRDACAELRGLDLDELARQAAGFLRATDASYAQLVDPELERASVPPLGELRRSDMPRFFRAAELDERFPAERLTPSFVETTAGLGIDLEAQPNVHLDTEQRETKTPRAFCATPRVPGEIYLVIAPVGGRDDFAALFHEGGHVQHFANVNPGLAFEFRHLGDNSVTESFAFLLEHLTQDPEWLRLRLGVSEPERVVRHSRAVKLVMLRRYAAKIAYELELHGDAASLDAMPARYSELLGGATRVGWPRASWLADVDPGFYVACYLRAWALETSWRRALGERYGKRWFASAEAGKWLRGLWRQGQRLDADELLQETLGERLELSVLATELAPEIAGAPPAMRATPIQDRLGADFTKFFTQTPQKRGLRMEASQSTRERVQSDLQKALEDLRKAGENASGDVRDGIDSAMTKIRDASSTSSGDIRDQLDSVREWLQSTTVDILDEVEKEIRKRREQIAGSGDGESGGGSSS